MSYDYLIIGGGVAGTTAAETIRQKDKKGSIGLISGEPHFLYSRVLLPEFIRGEAGLEKVMLRSEADYKKNNIEIFLGESIEGFDPEQMVLKTDKGREISAKKILIASGGRPKQWKPAIVQHSMLDNVFRLQTLDDALRIKKFLSEREAGRALVIGGGFMALEFIEVLTHYGWNITLLCKEERFWPDFLENSGFQILSDTWEKNGVEMIFGDKTNLKFAGVDFFGVGIGLERNLDFLPHLAVKPPSGGIEVNKHLETAFPNVWASGDVALYEDPFSWRKRLGGNWSGAFMQGRTAGANMSGGKETFKTISTYAITHLGLSIAFVGDVGPFSNDTRVKSGVLFFDEAKQEYVRVFQKDNKIIGAVMINGQKFLGTANQAIINKWDASDVFKKNT